MYTRANDGLALKKFFALCFGNIFASGTLIDPESTLLSDATTPAELAFDVCDEDQITLVVGWDVPGAPVEAALVTPAGTIVTSTATGTTSDAGTTWRFLRVGLPLQGEREGTWKARVWRRPPGELEELGPDLRYFVSVIADGGPLLTPPPPPSQRLYTLGDAVNPVTVALRYTDQTAPHADVELSVEAPDGSLGDLVMQHGLTEPDPNAEPIDSFRATLQQLAAEAGGELPLTRTTRTLELFDDGVHDDVPRNPTMASTPTPSTRFSLASRAPTPSRRGRDLRRNLFRQAGSHLDADVRSGIDPGRAHGRRLDDPLHAKGPIRKSPRARSQRKLRCHRPAGISGHRAGRRQRRRLLRRTGHLDWRRSSGGDHPTRAALDLAHTVDTQWRSREPMSALARPAARALVLLGRSIALVIALVT